MAVTLPDLDEALFHLALANLPADLRQQRIDDILDRRLELMAREGNDILTDLDA